MFTSTLVLAPTFLDQQKTVEKMFGVSFDPHPDLLVVDESPSISIEAARNIGVWLSSRPYASPKKTVIIFGAERLTIPAQQALLKTLEEPPKYAHIILTAANEFALLQTIQSRCVIVREKNGKKKDVDSLDTAVEIPQTYAEIFALSEELGKDRIVAVEWCVGMMQTLHHLLRTKPSRLYIQHLKALQQTLHHLKHNVNVKLAIESLCFQMKRVDV